MEVLPASLELLYFLCMLSELISPYDVPNTSKGNYSSLAEAQTHVCPLRLTWTNHRGMSGPQRSYAHRLDQWRTCLSSTQLLLLDWFMHAASLVEGTLVRGRSRTGMRFDSHLTAALLSITANSPWHLCEEAEESASPLVLWNPVRALCNLLVTGAFCALVWCNHQRFFLSPPTCHSPTPFCHVSSAYTVFLSSLRRYFSELSANTVPFQGENPSSCFWKN